MDEGNQNSVGSAMSGKIMISSFAMLLGVCSIAVLFHAYDRCFRRRPVRHLHHDNRRRRHPNAPATVISSQGLDLLAVNSLPTFVYASKTQESPLECAVCLSEFEDNESGRVLPACMHSFHVDCIDMWLQSHSDCPLCRARVTGQPVENPFDGMVSINIPEDTDSGSGSGQHPNIQRQDSSSRAPDVPSTGPTEPGPARTEQGPDPDSGPNPDGNIGLDVESGSKTPAKLIRVLKRLFSI